MFFLKIQYNHNTTKHFKNLSLSLSLSTKNTPKTTESSDFSKNKKEPNSTKPHHQMPI